MRLSPIIALAALLSVSTLCTAGLLSQPDSVYGEQVRSAGTGDGTIAASATHKDNKRGRWRIFDGELPPLEQVKSLPDDPMPIYGLYADPGLYLAFRQDIKSVGFSSFRLGRANGGGETTDRCIRAMIEDKVQPMIVLGAKKRDDFETDEAYIENALKQFAATIERYGPGGSFFKDHPDVPDVPVIYFQVLNEPNFQYMYRGTNTNDMIPIRHKLYAKLLPRTYAMIKARWPQVKVVGWTCGGAAAQDLPFVTNAIKANPAMATSFDVFSTHPYMSPVPPEGYAVQSWGGYAMGDMLSKIRKAFAAAGRAPRSYPVWYTEGGWKLRHADGGMSESGEHPPLEHAAYYVRYYGLGVRMGVARIMPMYIVDADGFNGGFFQRTSGWTRDNDKPMRVSAFAVKTMIAQMPNPKIESVISDGKDGVFAYVYQADKTDPAAGLCVMAWKITGGAESIELPAPFAGAAVTDMLGNSEAVEVVNGKVAVEIGPYPIYIKQAK